MGLSTARRRLHPLGANRSEPLRRLRQRAHPPLRAPGQLWAENPSLPRQPIRTWQLWNEPSASYFWATPNYARSYPALVRVAYDAIKSADPGATVVLGGLATFRKANGRITTSWADLAAFDRNGLRGHYDVLAVHPFAANLQRILKTIRLNRRVLKRNREGRKPIWVTELSWSSSPRQVPKSQRVGIEVSPRRQRALLTQAYKRLRRDRSLGVTAAYWYEWSSPYSVRRCGTSPTSFEFAGVVRGGLRRNLAHAHTAVPRLPPRGALTRQTVPAPFAEHGGHLLGELDETFPAGPAGRPRTADSAQRE